MRKSDSTQFDALRDHLNNNREVKREVEFAFSSLLQAANPTDRGARFVYGSGAEWIMAAAAWSAGILAAPRGHNENGFDLADLLRAAQGLWSVKASASPRPGDVRLTNYMGEGGTHTWTHPTLFVGPYLGGAVLIDPSKHPQIRENVKYTSDALTIKGRIIQEFANHFPENAVQFDVAQNPGGIVVDSSTMIRTIITPEHFPNLSKPFLASRPMARNSRVQEISQLAKLRDEGVLSDEQFEKAVDSVLQ